MFSEKHLHVLTHPRLEFSETNSRRLSASEESNQYLLANEFVNPLQPRQVSAPNHISSPIARW